ncbi:MAG: phage tail assembly protein [Anaerolineae bacterium]
MQTEFEFTLPKGFLDRNGDWHRHGRMRLALAVDEVESIRDHRVQENEAYLPVVLLARVVTQLGGMTAVTPDHIAHLFAADLAYLEDLYLRLNGAERIAVGAVCPHCQNQFQLQVSPIG